MANPDHNGARPSVASREMVLRVAMHYATLGWHVTPGYHGADGNCTKHPSVDWKRKQVEAGKIVGATTDPAELRRYFNTDGPLADICVHTVPSGFIGVECDRDWKAIMVKGEDGVVRKELVWVDGLKNLLDFLGGDLGTDLMSLSKRGLHAYYLVQSEVAQKIRTQSGMFLPGVDVRGGANSGGVLIETNGVCPHRRWVRGKPQISYASNSLGDIVGIEDYGVVRFDDQGRCISGLPRIDLDTLQPAGIGNMPAPLLSGLLLASRAIDVVDADPRAVVAMQELKSTKSRQKLLRATVTVVAGGAKPPRIPSPKTKIGRKKTGSGVADVVVAPLKRPWPPVATCTCGNCDRFEEARELLAWIPPEVNRELWLNIIWSVSHLLGHSACGAALCAAWSAQSQVESRCDPTEAERTYWDDRRYFEEAGVIYEDEDNDGIGMTFLPAVAVLCGAPDREDVDVSQVARVADRFAFTLVTECGVDSAATIAAKLLDVFPPINDDEAGPGVDMASGNISGEGSRNSSTMASAGRNKDPILVRMSDVKPQEIDWLWKGRIPVGRLTLLSGVPGLGKSFLTVDMAARISVGRAWPDGSPCKLGSVVLVSCEDDPADTIRPRLDACGADTGRVHVLTGVQRIEPFRNKKSETAFTLADLEPLDRALGQLGDVRLVVIDPVGSYFGAERDSHVDTEVRALLAPLAVLAQKHRVAILLVAHTRKSITGTADESVLGSRAFTGLARAVHHLMRDPDSRFRRLFLPGKCNLTVEQSGLGFRLAGAGVPAVTWDGLPVTVTADELVGRQHHGGRGEREVKGATVDWLREVLKVEALPAGKVKDLAAAAGFAWRTVQRASEALGIRPRKIGFDGEWLWVLPRVGDTPNDDGDVSGGFTSDPGGAK